MVRIMSCVLALLLPLLMVAQSTNTSYTIKGGRMKIEIDRNISPVALDSFIVQFELEHLQLKDLVFKNMAAAAAKEGWRVEQMNNKVLVITKAFQHFEGLNKPEGRIRFTEAKPTFAQRFPATNNGLTFGHNRFRNKPAFATSADSVVRFFLRGHENARKVMLAGSFNNWDPEALAMKRTEGGWEAAVKLGAGKYWYKFIADGNWMVDSDNLQRENDGEGNTNSIFFRTNTVFFLPGFEGAKNVYLAGSFNQWRPRDLAMQRTDGGWVLPLYLSEGTHTYKFVADGRWVADSRNPNQLPDGEGGVNSYLALGKSYLFQLPGFTGAKEVRVAGSFNNWRPFELLMRKTATGWELPYVLGPGNYEYRYWVDGQWMADPARPPLAGKNSSMVIGANHTFRLKGFEAAKQVFLAGDFNNWNPTSFPMQRQGAEWILPLHLWAGKHRYKFVVDGQWILDPENKLWEQNEHHTGNSILWFGK
jgi:hypothetical protein